MLLFWNGGCQAYMTLKIAQIIHMIFTKTYQTVGPLDLDE